MTEVENKEIDNLMLPKEKEREANYHYLHFMNKNEEIKFFLREYNNFEGQKFDYYYIIPFSWIKQWDAYISDTSYIIIYNISVKKAILLR